MLGVDGRSKVEAIPEVEMRAVVQRVSSARVRVAGAEVGSIGRGLAVLLGISAEDTQAEARAVAAKLAGLRVFADSEGRMNLDIGDAGGRVLLISQFTLVADVRKGRRPSFAAAADPETAVVLVEAVAEHLRAVGIEVEEGRFGAHMELELVNDGPVTIVIDAEAGRVI